ncbi:serine-threonineeeee kinase receptor-associated protein [Zalerion maritima]|uniref:Serine-threonine kinase receptor-associated protein n=1 Tax=Zalerion maritima TaxID=339359 RepID=A0AAD5RJQ0_9PEZI|nr:serine-threonineeeee kinase receptor-associated protein [Zalerion maritima]
MAETAPVGDGASLAPAAPAAPEPRRLIPVVCHGHTRPVTHLCFSTMKWGNYHIVSSSKDSIPLVREGKTGDWYVDQMGAIWNARESNDWTRAVSASADFSARVWDASTGELLYNLTHKHVVRAADFCPSSNDIIITASNDGVLRLWILSKIGTPTPEGPERIVTPVQGHWEQGQGEYVFTVGKHQPNRAIKYAVWLGYSDRAPIPDLVNKTGAVVTAQDKTVYWWQLSEIGAEGHDDSKPWKEYSFDSEITCCERFALDPDYAHESDIGGGRQVLGVAAGKKVVFWDEEGSEPPLRVFEKDWRVSSVAIDVKNGKVLMGQAESTWAVMVDWKTGNEEQVLKAHHGPIHSMSFSPDNKIFITGSEDGTVRLWKNCEGDYGLWKGKAAPDSG